MTISIVLRELAWCIYKMEPNNSSNVFPTQPTKLQTRSLNKTTQSSSNNTIHKRKRFKEQFLTYENIS